MKFSLSDLSRLTQILLILESAERDQVCGGFYLIRLESLSVEGRPFLTDVGNCDFECLRNLSQGREGLCNMKCADKCPPDLVQVD